MPRPSHVALGFAAVLARRWVKARGLWRHRFLAAAVLIAGMPGTGQTASLFTSPPDGAEALPAVAWARRVAVDGTTAEALARARKPITIDGIPLARGEVGTFQLVPVDIFSADARIVEFDGVAARPLMRPDVSVYEGEDVARPDRRMVLSVVDATRVWAVVREGTTAVSAIHPLADDVAPGAHAVIDLREAPASTRPLCDNHLHPGMLAPFGTRGGAATIPAAGTLTGPPLAAELLLDVGYDLYTRELGSSTAQAATYAASVVGAVSGIYRRDVNVAILIQQLVIWTTPDPFGGRDTYEQLQAYQSWNLANRTGERRDAAHLLANLSRAGGRAYRDALCDSTFGYGVSNLLGGLASFPTTGYVWDINIVAHELGHTFGSPHTHCYSPPLDRCYNQEDGCYSGPVVPSMGETMSYCHLVETIEMGFGAVVGKVVRGGAESANCVGGAPGTCGNGVLDPGEQCDDGNTTDGDCCGGTCAFEGPSVTCMDDGNPCTSDVCDFGVCTHEPPGTCRVCDASAMIPAAGGTFTGTTRGASMLAGSCGYTSTSPEQVFDWTPALSGMATLSTCSDSTTFDTVLYVRTGSCEDGGTQVGCNDYDSACTASPLFAQVTVPVTRGQTYYIVVDGYAGDHGRFALQVTAPTGCGPGGAAGCDDGNRCTIDACDMATGDCTNTPLDCDDGNRCTTDSCNPTTGCTTRPVKCNDSNPCTTDGCNPTTGCTATPVTCDAGEACTTGSCDPSHGCAYTPLSGMGGATCQLDAIASAITGAPAGKVIAKVGKKLLRLVNKATAVADAAGRATTGKQRAKQLHKLGMTVKSLQSLIARTRGKGLDPALADLVRDHARGAALALRS